jgi:2-C-methyl-D-erythritol 4-phosphate cytidylyltransferase
MLLERMGGRVLLHEAPAENLKVTTPLDLRVAELLVSGLAPERGKT